ncbi:MAG: histidine triad nucleotide-binding protein [Clostridiaceae bacterium]|jgi:histidine triad (HIT) family protein|nr:histidine triad nucleotide-binding protein [Clostridiaceae bacterium]
MNDCIFCKIINGEIPCSLVYQDEKILAFKDINPLAPVHVLVVSKQHIESAQALNESSSQIAAHIFAKIPGIAKELGIADSGYRVITNVGKDGGQAVPHLHFHILGGRKLETSLG